MTFNMIVEHAVLVSVSAFFLLIIGLSLGIIAYLYRPLRKPILFCVDVLQTVPTLAMLGLLMVVFGPTMTTVVIGLVLYSLLPVVLNTLSGLDGIDYGIKEAAVGMGMTKIQRLVKVELPLAFPMIFSGMRIAVVTSIGIAVFATFVGGGGLGKILYRGVRTQNMKLIGYGTISLVLMSLIVDGIMARYEKKLTQKRSH